MRNFNFILSATHTEKNPHLSPTERRNEGCEEGRGTDGKLISGGRKGDLQESKKRKDIEGVMGTVGKSCVQLCNACS